MQPTDWLEKTAEAAVSNVVKATERVRSIFLILNVACIIMLVGLWNQQGSWSAVTEQGRLRDAVAECGSRGLTDTKPPPDKAVAWAKCRELGKAYDTVTTMNWNEYNSVSVPVVGLRLDTDDITLLGSLAIMVLLVWWWFAHRRQNHATKAVYALATENPLLRQYIVHAVGGAFMFLTASHVHVPDRLDDERWPRWLVRLGSTEYRTPLFLRWLMWWLPVATVAFAIGTELLQLSQPSWASLDPNQSLWADITSAGKTHGPHTLAALARLIGAAVLLLFGAGRLLWACGRWSVSTNAFLRELSKLPSTRPETAAESRAPKAA